MPRRLLQSIRMRELYDSLIMRRTEHTWFTESWCLRITMLSCGKAMRASSMRSRVSYPKAQFPTLSSVVLEAEDWRVVL